MLFKLYLISIFCEVSKIQEILPILAKIKFQKLIIFFLLIGVLIDPELKNNLAIKLRSPVAKRIVLLIIWIIISIPFSVHPGIGFTYLTQHFWKVIVSFCLFLSYCSSKNKLEMILIVYLVSILLICVLSYAAAGMGRVSIHESWDANELGFLVLMALPFAVWKIKLTRGFKKIFFIVLSLSIVITIILTSSRASFIGLLTVSFLLLFQYKVFLRKSIAAIIIISIFGGIIFFISITSDYKARLLTIVEYKQDYNVQSSSGRVAVWGRGFKMMLENPVLGVGFVAFPYAEGVSHREEGGKWSAAHSIFIQVGSELGIIGLIIYCSIIWISLKKLLNIILSCRNIPSMEYEMLTACSFFAAIIVFCVNGMFLSLAYSSLFFFLFAFSCSFIELMKEKN